MGNEKKRQRVYNTMFHAPWRCERVCFCTSNGCTSILEFDDVLVDLLACLGIAENGYDMQELFSSWHIAGTNN